MSNFGLALFNTVAQCSTRAQETDSILADHRGAGESRNEEGHRASGEGAGPTAKRFHSRSLRPRARNRQPAVAMNWTPIAKMPGYEICAEGQIRNATTLHVMALQANKVGLPYLRVFYPLPETHGRRSKPHLLHRLLAETFIPNPRRLPVVRHLDGNCQNNALANLAWGTFKENSADTLRQNGANAKGKTWRPIRGELAERILALHAMGLSDLAISKQVGRWQTSVSRFLRRNEPIVGQMQAAG